MKVHEAMTLNKECVGPNDCINATTVVIARNHVESLPVLDHLKVMGTIGNRDIADTISRTGRTADSLNVRATMKNDPFSVFETDDLADADRRMDENNLQSITVLNQAKTIVGMLQRQRNNVRP